MNRLSTAGFVPPSVYIGFCLFVLSLTHHRSFCVVPGHALHEKGSQRQNGVGPLVGSQKRRALLVLVTNRLQTACQPLTLFLHSVYIGFRFFVLLEKRSGDVSSMPWGVRGTLVSWAYCSVGVPSCPAPPRRPAVRPDPTRPWYVRVLDSPGKRIPVESKTRTNDRRVRSERTAGRRSGVGQDWTPTEQSDKCPSYHPELREHIA